MANANDISKMKKNIIRLTEKREKQLAVLADIENELAEAQAQYNDALRSDTMQRLSKAMFSDHQFSADQIDKLIGLIDQFGTSISDMIPANAEAAEDNKNEIGEKVDTCVNF